MSSVDIEVSIETVKTWKIKGSQEKIQHADGNFYHFNANNDLVLDFPENQAPEYLQLCDEAVSNNCHAIPTANIHNTAFISMVLTQFLHVPKSTPAHDVEENI